MTDEFFGFTPVQNGERQQRVNDVFHRVANQYDQMNDLMSLGIHRLWKKAFIHCLMPTPDMQLIDVAGGTGDIAIAFLQELGSHKNTGSVHVCDINPNMMAVGQDRLRNKGYINGVQWTEGNGENLPFNDNTFDAYTIAFGLRNITNIPQALSEAYRVLKPGGQFLCLEFSQPDPWLQPFYTPYLKHVVPKMGDFVAKDREAYQYLAESILKFPNAPNLQKLIETAQFTQPFYQKLTGGIVYIHGGKKKLVL
jgi:demethylmenaquinone methyltransferase/2-methoxy-6-polyprenyl-1,4-benzoquinol methylase